MKPSKILMVEALQSHLYPRKITNLNKANITQLLDLCDKYKIDLTDFKQKRDAEIKKNKEAADAERIQERDKSLFLQKERHRIAEEEEAEKAKFTQEHRDTIRRKWIVKQQHADAEHLRLYADKIAAGREQRRLLTEEMADRLGGTITGDGHILANGINIHTGSSDDFIPRTIKNLEWEYTSRESYILNNEIF